MQVNSVNQNNSMNKRNVNFTSVVPMRVFIDDLPAFESQHIEKVVRKILSMLKNPQAYGSNKNQLSRAFKEKVWDYKIPLKKTKENENLIRTYLGDKGIVYLFTGTDAESVFIKGKAIGQAKATAKRATESPIEFKSINTFGIKKAKEYYHNFIEQLIQDPKKRLKELIPPKVAEELPSQLVPQAYIDLIERFTQNPQMQSKELISPTVAKESLSQLVPKVYLDSIERFKKLVADEPPRHLGMRVFATSKPNKKAVGGYDAIIDRIEFVPIIKKSS